MLEDDLLGDGKAEARALGLRGHEELEDVQPLGEAGTGVPDRDRGVAVHEAALHLGRASPGHGFDRVLDEVDDDLLDLLGVDAQVGNGPSDARPSQDDARGPGLGPQEAHDLVEERVDARGAVLDAVRPRELQEVADEVVEALDLLADDPQELLELSGEARLQRRHPALEDGELERYRVQGIPHLVGEAGGEGADHRHLLVLDDAGLRLVQVAIGPTRLLVEVRALDGDRRLRRERLRDVQLVVRPGVGDALRDREKPERRAAGHEGQDERSRRVPPPRHLPVRPLVLRPVREAEGLLRDESAALQARPERDEVEDLALAQLGMGEPREMGNRELPGVGAQEDLHAVGGEHLERRLADAAEDRVGVQHLSDALVQGGERPRLLVVQALGVEVPRALDREADLAPHGLEEAKLVLAEAAARTGGHVQHSPARSVEGEGDAGVGDGPLRAVDDGGHSRTLCRVARLQGMGGREDLGTEAAAEAVRLDLPQVDGRDAAVGREAELPVVVVAEEHPPGRQAEAVQDLVECDLQHSLDGVLAVDSRSHSRQDEELSLTLVDLVPESTDGGVIGRRGGHTRSRERQVLRHPISTGQV